MTYRTCPECGAHLDPEEKCDCEHNAETGENDKKKKRLFRNSRNKTP